jgi:hypothetical protein
MNYIKYYALLIGSKKIIIYLFISDYGKFKTLKEKIYANYNILWDVW